MAPNGSKSRMLLISYYFPPNQAVGGIRIAKFAKFLPEFSWQPYVLTIKEKYIPFKDHGRLTDIPNIKVYCTSVWPTLYQIALQLRTLIYRWLKKNDPKKDQINTIGDTDRGRTTRPLAKLWLNLKRNLNSLFEIPDEHIGWLIPAVWKGYWLIRKEHIKVILSTSPPATGAVIGYILSKLTGKTLITELRDPWQLHGAKPSEIRSKMSDFIDEWLEHKITHSSHRIVVTTNHYRDFLRARYPRLPSTNFCTISNGFDSDDFKFPISKNGKKEQLIISYLGSFYYGRTPKAFLSALGEIVREARIAKHKVRVRFIGRVQNAEGDSVEALVNESGLKGCVTLNDTVTYNESVAEMRRADILLLFAPDQYYQIPGKTFEYLAAGRFIICFAKEGATADLIRKTRGGIVIDPEDVPGIKTAILELYSQWESGKQTNVNGVNLRGFERRALTEKLVHNL